MQHRVSYNGTKVQLVQQLYFMHVVWPNMELILCVVFAKKIVHELFSHPWRTLLPVFWKQYLCFLVNILAALLIFFIPNLVRKCQLMSSRIWAEEIMFLKFFGTVSKENRLLLVIITTVVKESFPQFISKYFLFWCCFCKQKLYQRLGTWDIFSRRFSIVHFYGNRAQNLNIYQHFLWFCKFQFYIYTLTNIQGCVVLFAQNILF